MSQIVFQSGWLGSKHQLTNKIFQKDWFAVFKVKVTVKDNIIKIWLSSTLSELLILLLLNFVYWYIIRWIVLWKDWIALLWSRSRKRLRIPVNVHLDGISSAAEPSVTILGMVMQHHGPKCPARRLVCCLQFRVTVSTHLINLTVSTISAELLIFLQPNLIGWYIIISLNVLFKN